MERVKNEFPTSKIPQWVAVLTKRLILVVSWGYILYRFIFDDSFNVSRLFYISIDNNFLLQITLVLTLVFVNWGLESYKWKFSLSGFHKISFPKSFLGVLFGLSVAIFTPNRSGEYVGRIWVIPSKFRVKSVVATVFANILQLSVTLIFGAFALCFWQKSNELPFQLDFGKINLFVIIFFLILLVLIFSLLFFILNPTWFKRTIIQPIRDFVSYWTIPLTIKVWCLSFCRYLVFIVQFWLLLKIFDAQIPFIETFYGVGIMYLVMALLPILTFAEPAVRSALSVAFLSVFNSNDVGIISASLAMWVFNLVIPSVIGSIMLNSLKTKKYD